MNAKEPSSKAMLASLKNGLILTKCPEKQIPQVQWWNNGVNVGSCEQWEKALMSPSVREEIEKTFGLGWANNLQEAMQERLKNPVGLQDRILSWDQESGFQGLSVERISYDELIEQMLLGKQNPTVLGSRTIVSAQQKQENLHRVVQKIEHWIGKEASDETQQLLWESACSRMDAPKWPESAWEKLKRDKKETTKKLIAEPKGEFHQTLGLDYEVQSQGGGENRQERWVGAWIEEQAPVLSLNLRGSVVPRRRFIYALNMVSVPFRDGKIHSAQEMGEAEPMHYVRLEYRSEYLETEQVQEDPKRKERLNNLWAFWQVQKHWGKIRAWADLQAENVNCLLEKPRQEMLRSLIESKNKSLWWFSQETKELQEESKSCLSNLVQIWHDLAPDMELNWKIQNTWWDEGRIHREDGYGVQEMTNDIGEKNQHGALVLYGIHSYEQEEAFEKRLWNWAQREAAKAEKEQLEQALSSVRAGSSRSEE